MMNVEVTSLTLAVAGLAVTLALYYLLTKRKDNYPPGPTALPVIGNIPQLVSSGSIVAFCKKYRKQFGNVSLL